MSLPFIGQNKYEFAVLQNELERLEVKSFLEIGILRGGVLARIGLNFPHINLVGIDPCPQVAVSPSVQYLEYSRSKWGVFDPQIWNEEWGILHIVIGESQSEESQGKAWAYNGNKKFDAIFIDGDHEYEMVKQDWLWAKLAANKLVAFHDVCHCEDERITVWKLWDELKIDPNLNTLQLVGHGPDPQGIGIVYL